MTQQKSKKTTSMWVQCEHCKINIFNKDSDVHLEDCPPNFRNFTYNFISGGCLYGTLDLKSIEAIRNLSSREVDNLVFLSQTAIQLCMLSIGDWALVELLDKSRPPIAKIVWPTTEKSLSSVLMSKASIDLNLMTINQKVKVSKLSNETCFAKSVTLVILNAPKSIEFSSELYNRISKSYEGRFITKQNIIHVMFYGKILKFEVKSVETCNNETNLENNLSKLSIQDKYQMFKVHCHTKWKLYRDDESYKKEILHKNDWHVPVGVDDELNEIRDMIETCLKGSQITHAPSIRSVLLYGNSGTGKTTVANFLADEATATVVSISAPDLYSKYTGSVEETLKQLFQKAFDESPSIIILDEIDLLCPLRSNRLSDLEKRILSTLLILMDSLHYQKDTKVFVIATSNKIDNIDPSFRRCGRLDREIEIPTPTPKARKAILNKLIALLPHKLNDDELQNLSIITHGFVGADLVSLISHASLNASKRSDSGIKAEDFKFALTRVRPSAMREVQIEVPNVKWTDIGGQQKLKLILRQAVEWPIKYPESFIRLGVMPPKGVLMFGPPGCSKTMIAKALATESGLNFLSIKGPELFSKWVGESERAVREVFRKARQVAPSIIFFDEIDAIGGERSSGSSTSVQERVLAQLLTELDGVTPLGDITVLAATNRPDRIDKALLRPGRLDRIVYVQLPDENTRKDIFNIKLSKMPTLNVDIEDLVQRTINYSGAEINAICDEAAMMALEENLEIRHVEHRHFESALKLITPRTPPSLIKLYEDYIDNKI